jgi:hypothetical protein
MRNKIIKNLIKATAGIVVVAAAYAAGAGMIPMNFSLATDTEVKAAPEPVHTPTVEARLVETHTVEYVEETVIATEYVDVIREVPTKLRNFTTLRELEQWINGEIRTATLRFSTESKIIDCDDYAFEMQQEALADGYIISFQIISRSEYNEMFAASLPEGQSLHAINLAIIGNSVFYIEPQTGEVVHAAYLD